MIIFVIPVYNEEKNIITLLNKTNEKMLEENLSYKVIIINDGSTDNTAKLAESLKDRIPLDLYSYYPNKGVGEAFRMGFCKALQICKDGDVIVTKEADNTSDLTILDKLICKIKDGYDIVLASCYAQGGKVLGTTVFRRILSRAANVLLKLFIPIKDIHTYSSFYRAYSCSALREIHNLYGDKLIEETGFESMVELLMKFTHHGRFKITEIPMVLDVSKRLGKSKMQVFKTIKGFLKVILKEGIVYRMT